MKIGSRRVWIVVVAGALSVLPAGWTHAERALPPREGPPVIHVIYPHPNQEIAPVDSTFILGSVNPGSTLTINGRAVPIYRTGGFLAWLPVYPGGFTFRLKAKNRQGTDTLSVPVRIADARPIPADSGVRIRPGSVRPMWDRTIRPGEEVNIAFDGTVGCRARFWVMSAQKTFGPFPMTELRSPTLSDYSAYRRDLLLVPDSLPLLPTNGRGGGRYNGLWRVPAGLGDDTLRVRVSLRGRGKSPDSMVAMATGLLVPVESLPPRVVELTDSVQILRLGPRLGYFTIAQPYGVRARWWGEAGPWTVLQPAPGYEAWIETEKIRLLPEGTPLPSSSITRLYTVADSQSVRLVIGTGERLPFKVTVDDDLKRMTLLIFGATANTDWIEADPADQMIDDIAWSQLVPQVYQIDIGLREPLWGYEARYEDERLVLEFRQAPVAGPDLRGLTVAVDPGHSADPGAVGPTGLVERDANLHLAQATRWALEALGADVVMTRADDEDVPLYDRPGRALTGGADLYVSVHNNAVSDGINPYTKNGTGTYYHHPFSRALGRAVHRRVREATGLDDYGLTQANFAVIRSTQFPAVLVECAFIILPEQEELLDNDAFITRTGKGIAEGVADFIRARQPRK